MGVINIYTHTHTHVYLYISIYIYIYATFIFSGSDQAMVRVVSRFTTAILN